MRQPAILIFILALWATANSAIITVPGDSATIQAGISGAVNGDTVLVADGTYTGEGNRDLTFGGKNIVLMSESGANVTIIDCQGDSLDEHIGFLLTDGEDTTAVVDGFMITGAWLSGYRAAAVRLDGSSVMFKNCIVTGNNGCGIRQEYGSEALRIYNCIATNNEWYGVWAEGASTIVAGCELSFNGYGGMNWSSWQELELCDCLFDGNGNYGLFVWTDSPDFCVYNCTFVNNLVGLRYDWNFPRDGSSNGSTRFDTSAITGCLFAFNTVYGLYSDMYPYPISLSCNNSFGNGTDYAVVDDSVNNISFDPLLCDTANSVYTVDVVSPCVASSPLNPCGTMIGRYGVGCALATDTDGDGVADEMDNCPNDFNPLQEDTDTDGRGDTCDCCLWSTGNVDGDPDEIIDIGDVTALIDHLFIRPGAQPPVCMEEANADGDPGGIVDIGDVTALIDYLYIRPGVEPPAECP